MLQEFEDLHEVLEHGITDALGHEVEERPESELSGQVLLVDFCAHGVAPIWVQVVQLLLDLLNGGKSSRPGLGQEACHDLQAHHLDEGGVLLFLLVSERLRVWQDSRRLSWAASNVCDGWHGA